MLSAAGLPKDASAEEVHKFFDKRYGGPVAEVQLIANDMKIIKYYQTFSKLVLKLGVAVGVHIWRKDNATQVDKVAAKAGKISEKIAQMRQRQDWKVLCAYVTFKHARTRDVCIATTQRTGFWGWIGSRFCTAKKNRFRGKHTLRISEAPSPADIIYENLRLVSEGRSQTREEASEPCSLLSSSMEKTHVHAHRHGMQVTQRTDLRTCTKGL